MLRRSLLTILLIAATAMAGCSGDSPTSPGDIGEFLTERFDTASISFRFSGGDTMLAGDADWQQQYHEWATARLGVSLPGKLRYNKYRDNAQMNAAAGRGCCFAEPETLTVHTLYPRDNHEVVHVYSVRGFGSPSNFLSEGLAVSFQVDPVAGDFTPRWSGVPVHDLARTYRQGGQLFPVGDMLTTVQFRAHPEAMAYQQAGSFVAFLIETYGLDPFLAQFRGANPNDSAARVRSAFQQAFGFSIEQAEAEWHAMLDGAASGYRP